MKIRWKTILMHLLFWALYLVIWGVGDTAYAPSFLATLDSNLIGSFFYSIGVYVNLYLFIPKLLLKGEKVLYVVSIVSLVLIIGYSASQGFAWYFKSIHLGTSEFFGSVQGMVNTSGEFLVLLALATSFYFISQWYVKERKIHELENRNLKAELDMLKGQINPHFLFNALNSVHVLIRKDREKAQETLEKFSDLLSHQLYDVNKDKITLEQEVKNLDNFIQLQKMRHEDHVQVKWKAKGVFAGKKISPMLFLNFVENAFKHGESNSNGQVKIDILIAVQGDQLEFACVNSINKPINRQKNLGLGITNVRRRLDLIYPDRHDLQIEESDEIFSVNLSLDLNEN